jgi:hypothetical protein
MVARTLPGKQFEVARELRVRVAVAFQREGIGTSADAGAEPDPVARETLPAARDAAERQAADLRLAAG